MGAGRSTNVVGRLLATRLAASLGQPFVVQNRPGATGTIGHAEVARARPDGHTPGSVTFTNQPPTNPPRFTA